MKYLLSWSSFGVGWLTYFGARAAPLSDLQRPSEGDRCSRSCLRSLRGRCDLVGNADAAPCPCNCRWTERMDAPVLLTLRCTGSWYGPIPGFDGCVSCAWYSVPFCDQGRYPESFLEGWIQLAHCSLAVLQGGLTLFDSIQGRLLTFCNASNRTQPARWAKG